MSVEHHVGGDLLLAYGTGSLDEATSLLVATHLALCPACRHELDLVEEVCGAMLDVVASCPGRPAPTVTAEPGPFVLPQPLRDYAGGDAGTLRWRALGGGIRHVPFRTGGTDTIALNAGTLF